MKKNDGAVRGRRDMELNTDTFVNLRRKALLLVWIGVLWNVAEAGVALWASYRAGSVALLAFGLDSVIELIAGGVLIRHLSKEWTGGEANDRAEQRAHQLVGLTFVALSGLIAVQSGVTLAGWISPPGESIAGIVLVLLSGVVMFVLYLLKAAIAAKINSPALRAEAVESLICDLQDGTVLIGLALNALFGWWWTDPLAALALIPFLLKEAREALEARSEADDDAASNPQPKMLRRTIRGLEGLVRR